MNLLDIPWLEVALLVSLLGAACVSRVGDSFRAYRWGLNFAATVLACTILAWLAFARGASPTAWTVQASWFGRPVLALDELNAPVIPALALLHYLVTLATARTKMRRFSFSWSLASLALRLAIFSCQVPALLVALLLAGVVPPYLELVKRHKPTRVFVLHMALFAVLLLAGWNLRDPAVSQDQNLWASLFLLGAILVRCGTIPVHCWVTDWFEHASFGNALLFVAPLVGVHAAIRLVLPIAPDWVLASLGILSLGTAVYAAALTLVQREGRRFFAYLFLSHASLVLVGLELSTSISLTGSLCLWLSVIVSLGGFGLVLRALEARFGRLSLDHFHGLYEHTPMLATCFLLTGFASVGFPGTLGFVATELLVDGAVEFNIWIGLGVVAAAALNGIAVLRAYFLLFTGSRHVSAVPIGITARERIGVLTLTVLVIGGGLFPQPGVAERYRAARHILQQRMAASECNRNAQGALTACAGSGNLADGAVSP